MVDDDFYLIWNDPKSVTGNFWDNIDDQRELILRKWKKKKKKK